MKTSKDWGRFATTVSLASALGVLVSCSSQERRSAQVPVDAPQSQSAYTDYASDQVAYWRDRAKQVPEADRARLAAALRDAQVTLDQLKRADGATWRTYRTRMEDSLANVERVRQQAKLER